MNRVIRATELHGLPVVTMGGDDVAEVRDVVYEAGSGSIVGFTLNKRGRFRGRLREMLALTATRAIGRDAVMVDDAIALDEPSDAPVGIADASAKRDVIGAAVLTDTGTRLGTVTDVIVSLGHGAQAVGYELSIDRPDGDGRPRFIPLPEQLAVSGDALMVPEEVDRFVRDDLSGFGAAVTEFRAQLGETPSGAPAAGAPAPAGVDRATSRTKDDLYREARQRNILGRSKMTRVELEQALSQDTPR